MDSIIRHWFALCTRRTVMAIILSAGVGLAPAEAAPRNGLLTAADAADFREAFRWAERDNWPLANRHAQRAKEPLLRKVLQWMELSRRGNSASFTDIVAFIAANPDWPHLRRLERRAEEAIDENTPSKTALGWFSSHRPATSDGLIAYGEALIASGEAEKGKALIRRAWIDGTFNRRSSRLFLKQYGKLISKEDHWARLDNLLWRGRHEEAQQMMRRVSPGRRAVALARMRLRRSSGGVDWAINQVPQALLSDPGLLYERLRWRVRKGRSDDALQTFETPIPDMGRPELWAEQRMRLARSLLADGRVTDAWRTIKDHAVPTEKRAAFAEAEWLAGWIALRFLGEREEALKRFSRLYDEVRYPVSKSRAAYWAGRAASAMQNSRMATEWYQRAAIHPTTYHGQLAALEIGDKPRQPPPADHPTADEEQNYRKHELVRIARLLNEIDQHKHVKTFVLRLGEIARNQKQRILAARFAHAIGRPDLGVWLSRQAQRSGIILIEHGYPLVPMPDGDPERALLMAVARQESNFDPRATSHAGARGLMQLMPATAREVARSMNIGYSQDKLTADPAYNVRLGRSYLKDMLATYNDSYILAIASYNAGPNNVRKWIRRNGDPRLPGIDPIDWIELIPFDETRNYVQRVLGNLQVFRHRLQPGKVAVTLKRDLQR